MYVDEVVISGIGFGLIVFMEFSNKKNYLWEVDVYMYWVGWNFRYCRRMLYRVFVEIDFVDFEV